jgi:hypothetical protein
LRYRVPVSGAAELAGVYRLVDVNHEGMKVNASLAADLGREGIVKEVHEHGLSGSDIAVQVEALGYSRRRCCGVGRGVEEPSELESVGECLMEKGHTASTTHKGTSTTRLRMGFLAK